MKYWLASDLKEKGRNKLKPRLWPRILINFSCSFSLTWFACVQTSPISFVARGKETFSACNKGNRRRLHAGNHVVSSYANFLEERRVFTWEKNSIRTGFFLYSKMAAVSLFCTTNMATETSCKCQRVITPVKTSYFLTTIRVIIFGVKTCKVFLCFLAIIFLGSIALTSRWLLLYQLF